MGWNLQQMDDPLRASRELKEARHRGWLAGVALRLGCGVPGRNPYEPGTAERLEWNIGFDEGFQDNS